MQCHMNARLELSDIAVLGAAVQLHHLKLQAIDHLLYIESLMGFVDGKNHRIAVFVNHAGKSFSDVTARSFLEL